MDDLKVSVRGYFKVQDPGSGKTASVGLAFEDRNESFDFWVMLGDVQRQTAKKTEKTEEDDNYVPEDRSLEKGKKIHVSLKGLPKKEKKEPRESTARMGFGPLHKGPKLCCSELQKVTEASGEPRPPKVHRPGAVDARRRAIRTGSLSLPSLARRLNSVGLKAAQASLWRHSHTPCRVLIQLDKRNSARRCFEEILEWPICPR